MKIVMQRVKRAAVSIDEATVGAIDQGLLLLVGVGPDDQQEDLDYAVRKIVNMRIFSDDNGKMNLSVQDIKGKILSVSQVQSAAIAASLCPLIKQTPKPSSNAGKMQELYYWIWRN